MAPEAMLPPGLVLNPSINSNLEALPAAALSPVLEKPSAIGSGIVQLAAPPGAASAAGPPSAAVAGAAVSAETLSFDELMAMFNPAGASGGGVPGVPAGAGPTSVAAVDPLASKLRASVKGKSGGGHDMFTTGAHKVTTINGQVIDAKQVHKGNSQKTALDFAMMTKDKKGAFNGANIFRQSTVECMPPGSVCDITPPCSGGACMPPLPPYVDVEEPPPMMDDLPALDPVDGSASKQVIQGISCQGGDIVDLEKYAKCNEVVGMLSIRNSAILNLDALKNIESIVSNPLKANSYSLLLSGNLMLKNVNGLSNIKGALPAGIFIGDNSALQNLNGLKGVSSVNGLDSSKSSIQIVRNDALKDISGLSGIKGSVPGGITIEANPKLQSSCGLKNIAVIGKDKYGLSITMVSNKNMKDMCLTSTKTMKGGMMMVDNYKVTNFNKMCNLNFVGKDKKGVSIQITNHKALSQVDCLKSLKGNVGGAIQVKNNCALKDLKGFKEISSVGKDSVNGTSLLVLGNCDIKNLEGFGKVKKVSGGVVIDQNNKLQSANLNGLASIGKSLQGESLLVRKNPELIELISKPSAIPGSVYVNDNPKLSQLQVNANSIGKDFSGMSLDIQNSGLKNLAALKPVNVLEGGLAVAVNKQLKSLDMGSFGSIGVGKQTGNSVEINSNPSLQSIQLGGIKKMAGGVMVNNNKAAKSLDLQAVPSIPTDLSGNSISVQDSPIQEINMGSKPTALQGGLKLVNSGLKDLSSLKNVNSLGNSLQLVQNQKLSSLNGLEKVHSIGSDLKGNAVRLHSNPVLKGVDALSGVKGAVKGSVEVINNAMLVNIDGLKGISGLGANNKGQSIVLANNSKINSIKGLAGVSGAIPGSVSVTGNPFLETLWGLDKITQMGADQSGNSMYLAHNAMLENLKGLRACTSLEGALVLQQLPMLKTLEGLQRLKTISGTNALGDALMVVANPKLESLAALNGLHGKLAGAISIDANAKLTTIVGLEGITSVKRNVYGNALEIIKNPALKSLGGLKGLNGALNGAISIEGNSALESLDGLNNVKGISGASVAGASLAIIGNPSIKNVDALSNLGGPIVGSVVIQKNPALSNLNGLGGKNPIQSSGTVVIDSIRCLSAKDEIYLKSLCASSTCHNSIQKVTKCHKHSNKKVLIGAGVGRVCGGKSDSKWSLWKAYGSSGLYIDVNTKACGFKITPAYVSSIMGDSAHWQLVGVNSIYSATPTGFRIYVWHPVLRGSFMKYFATKYKWQVSWMANTGRHGGMTKPGASGWKQFAKDTVVLDVDTKACGYKSTPSYVASLHGVKDHWRTQGVHSLYFATKTGFRVYVMHGKKVITPKTAEDNKWAIGWIGSTDAAHSGFGTSTWSMMCGSKDFECSPTAHFFSLYNDVSVKAGLFTATPSYVTSVSGKAHHLVATGGASVYRAKSTGFRVYMDKSPTPDVAKEAAWKVNWIGYETPRDCKVSTWSTWSKCSKTCGGGKLTRSRSVLVAATFQGKCPALSESKSCNTQCCSVNEVSHLTAWSKCSKSCGDSVQTRKKVIDIQASCSGISGLAPTLMRKCKFIECDVECRYSKWSMPTACTKSCGTGTTTRTRKLMQSGKGKHRNQCTTKETTQCNVNICPQDCKYTAWDYTNWLEAPCSTSCVRYTPGKQLKGPFGIRKRQRHITRRARFGGKACPPMSATQVCGNKFCPFHCKVSMWSAFKSGNKACSKKCGGGKQTRTRQVIYKAAHGGVVCPSISQTRSCNAQCCPVDQVASPWAPWAKCSRSCEYGTQSRVRSQVTAAKCGGKTVAGSWSETRLCNHHCCPRDAVAGQWGSWGSCTKSCGVPGKTGLETRTRNPVRLAECGGKIMPALKESRACKRIVLCPVHCKPSPWSKWSSCSKSCTANGQKSGTRTRYRSILSHAMHNGYQCGALKQGEFCNKETCMKDCKVSSWSDWDSFFDGKSKLRRTRVVLVPPTSGGKPCPKLQQFEAHTKQHCKGKVTNGQWSECTKKCGTGYKYRYHQKLLCSKSSVVKYHMTFRQGEHCNIQPCSVDADWAFVRKVKIPPIASPIPKPTAVSINLDEASWVTVNDDERMQYGLGKGHFQKQH
jgi:hypothetical protein